MNSISQTESKTMREYVATFDNALLSLREAESKLHEIKYNLDSMVQTYCHSDTRRQKQYRESMKDLDTMGSYARLEEIILKNVVPLIKFSRTRVEPARYQKYLSSQNLSTSLKIFRDETATVLQDQTMYKNFKAFREIYKTPERTYFDISYDALIKYFSDGYGPKTTDKAILIRFEKSLEYSELPEIFYICYVRVDLITVTLVFRKIPPHLQTDSGKKEDGENGHTEGGKIDKNQVTLINVTYSHIFDGQPPTEFQKKPDPFYLFPDFAPEDDNRQKDPEILELLEMIQQNAHRVSLPVLCSSMSVYQRHTHILQERLENYIRMIQKTFEKKERREEHQKTILNIIMKQGSDEFMSNLENKCGMCHSRFSLDSQYQKLLPPIKVSDKKNDRLNILHSDCRKILKRESNAPQIIVEVDCSDDNNTFNL